MKLNDVVQELIASNAREQSIYTEYKERVDKMYEDLGSAVMNHWTPTDVICGFKTRPGNC